MGKKTKSRKGDWVEADKPLNNPFAALQARKAPAAPVEESKPDIVEEPVKRSPARAVVRLERKGRGGKTVTVVTHLGLDAEEAGVWCKELRRKLGCGGQVEEDQLVFHGDQRDRVMALLEGKGVRRVTAG